MALENIRLWGANRPSDSHGNYRIREDSPVSGGHAVQVTWTTLSGAEVNGSFTVEVRYRGYAKGGPETGWSGWFSRDYQAAQLSPALTRYDYPDGGGGTAFLYKWGVSVSDVTGGALGSAQWSYAGRAFDQIQFEVFVTAHHTAERRAQYPDEPHDVRSAAKTLWLGYFPTYTLTSARYLSSDKIAVEYSSADWSRADDRWSIDECSLDGVQALGGSKPYGTVARPGMIVFPTSALARSASGREMRLKVRFNAAYRQPESSETENPFAVAVGTFAVAAPVGCMKPVIRPAHSALRYGLAFSTSADESSGGVRPDVVTVKMHGGKYKLDEVTVATGETAHFPFPPLNDTLTFDAVAGMEHLSDVVRQGDSVGGQTVRADGISVVQPISGDSYAELRYDQDVSLRTKPNVETHKFEGRRRPSAFYGSGGETSVQLSGTLVGEDGAALEDMPTLGDCMIRLPDGRRYACTVESSHRFHGPYTMDVSITGTEVDA